MKAHFNGSILVPVLLGYWLYRVGRRVGYGEGAVAALKSERTTVTFGPGKTEFSTPKMEFCTGSPNTEPIPNAVIST